MEQYKIRYSIFKSLLGIAFLAYYRPKFINKRVIPKDGPILVCGNHIHLYDQCLPILSTNRMLHYLAKKEYFDGKFAWFFKGVGCISVDREHHGGDSKKVALELLNNGLAVGLYPEGTRNSVASKDAYLHETYELYKDEISLKKFKKIMKKNLIRTSQIDLLKELLSTKKITISDYKKYIINADYNLKKLLQKKIITIEEYNKSLLIPLKYGTVSMAEKSNAWIVPYGIKGKYKFWNNDLTIEFGIPFKVENMTLEEANDKLTHEITNLIISNK